MSYGQHLASGVSKRFVASTKFRTAVLLVDLLKTRLQQGGLQAIPVITRNIVAVDGVLGLWRGTLPTLARNVPGVALYMATLQHVRSAMARSPYFSEPPRAGPSPRSVLPTLTSQGNLIAGTATRAAVGLVLNPFSVLKARFESGLFSSSYRHFGGAFRSLVHAGPAQLFRGAAASALRDAPHAGLFLVSYEHLKRESAALLHPMNAASATLVNACAGAGAGTVATLATHPFDVLKTRLQVHSEERYQSLRSTARAVWNERGARGFLDGVSLRLARKVLSSAIGWAVYEVVLLAMHEQCRDAL